MWVTLATTLATTTLATLTRDTCTQDMCTGTRHMARGTDTSGLVDIVAIMDTGTTVDTVGTLDIDITVVAVGTFGTTGMRGTGMLAGTVRGVTTAGS